VATDRQNKKRDARPLHNCIGCGRDTRAKDQICSHCRGGRAMRRPDQDMPIEDDYSEDSDPDSVNEKGLYW